MKRVQVDIEGITPEELSLMLEALKRHREEAAKK